MIYVKVRKISKLKTKNEKKSTALKLFDKLCFKRDVTLSFKKKHLETIKTGRGTGKKMFLA